MGLIMGIEANPAFKGLVTSIEKPGFQADLFGGNVFNADRYLTFQLSSLSVSEQGEVGTLILYGLSSGTTSWDENTQRTAALVFSRLNLGGISDDEMLGLKNNYFRAVRRQREIPVAERSIDALLTIGMSLMPQLFMRTDPSDLRTEMYTAWDSITASSSPDENTQTISEKVRSFIDLFQENQIGRSKDLVVIQRRGHILPRLQQGKSTTRIHEESGIPIQAVKNDRRVLKNLGLLPEIGRPKNPETALRQARILPLLLQGKSTTQIHKETGIPTITINRDRRDLKNQGLLVEKKMGRPRNPTTAHRQAEVLRRSLLGQNPTQISKETGYKLSDVNSDRYRLTGRGLLETGRAKGEKPSGNFPSEETIVDFRSDEK